MTGGQAARTRPFAFVPNRGQVDPRVQYYAQSSTFSAYFTDRGVTLDLHKGDRAAALVVSFPGSNSRAMLTGARRARATVNYFTGRRRYTSLPTYGQVRYHDLWPGIDLVFRTGAGQLKYEFLLRPGADPSDVRLAYAGADSLALDHGALVVGTPVGPLRDASPVAREGRHTIPSAYALKGSSYGFTLGRHNRARPLVIDPGLAWSTYLGGAGEEDSAGVATDPQGNAYVAGRTFSGDFPTTPGAYNRTYADVFVSKFSADGALVYSTFIAPSDSVHGIAVDANGSAYLAGTTADPSFPTTPGAYRSGASIMQNHDWRYVTKLNPQGSGLDYSTLVGDVGLYYYSGAIAIDSQGAAYTTGYTNSTTYPTTPGAYQTTPPSSGAFGYLTKLNPTGTGLDYSTFLNGAFPGRVTVDAGGHAYLTGGAVLGLPTTAGSYNQTWSGGSDAFVTEFDPSGSTLVFSTFIGGSGSDSGTDLKVDGSGIYVTGRTDGSGFPTTPGAFDRTSAAGDAFVTKLNRSGSGLVYSTLVGGSDYDAAASIALLGKEAVITGDTQSVDFPTASADVVNNRYSGSDDSFVTVLNDSGSGLLYSTYLGGTGRDLGLGVATDGQGNVYVSGDTTSTNFPTTPGAYQTTNRSATPTYDLFLTKIGIAQADAYVRPRGATPALFSLVPANVQCTDGTITHGAPLSYPSCAPPQLTSSFLTTGTPDSNGKAAGMEASLLMQVHPGNPATPANEADVNLTLHVNDVLTKDLRAYTGGLRGLMNVRITDGDPAGNATTIDFPFGFNAPCVQNGKLGSSCDATTSVNAVMPGAVQEGRRAIWGLDRIRVFDGGPDGDPGTAAGNTQFLTQGLFVP